MAKGKRVRPKVGDVVLVPLGDAAYGFARVLREPLMAFYELRSSTIPPMDDILRSPVAFVVFVMNHAITDRIWQVIGNAPLDGVLLEEPLFFKKDPVSGKLTIYRDSTAEEMLATRQECDSLECAAVWSPEYIVDRLRDHFAGKPNKWVESLRATD